MTPTTSKLGVSLALALLVLAGCDTKNNSVSGTASGSGTSGGDATGSGTGGAEATSGDGGSLSSGDGGTFGDETSSGGIQGGECRSDVVAIGVGDESSVGLTPAELVDSAAGRYTGTLQWAEEGFVQFNGDPGPIGIIIDVVDVEQGGRSIDGELLSPCNHDGPCSCPDSLEVPVVLLVQTTGGAFNENFAATLVHEVDPSGFGNAGTSVAVRFQPEDIFGTFSSASLDFVEGVSLEYLEFRLLPGSGTLSGGINASVETLDGIGYGSIANLGAVLDSEACASFSEGDGPCQLAGCVAVPGTPLQGAGAGQCDCQEPRTYCFGEPLSGEDTATLYTRSVEDSFESYDEVVAFGVESELGGPWRTCSDAPDVAQCGCTDTCE